MLIPHIQCLHFYSFSLNYTILSQLPKDICCILQLKIIFASILWQKSYTCQYLPLEPYLPCWKILVNTTGKYQGLNLPPNLGRKASYLTSSKVKERSYIEALLPWPQAHRPSDEVNWARTRLLHLQAGKVRDMQFGFVPGRDTTDAILIFRQLQEKYLATNKPLNIAFVDLEKAFDSVPRKVPRWALRSVGVEEWTIRPKKKYVCLLFDENFKQGR